MCSMLEVLHLNGNDIRDLPTEIGALTNLKELDLSQNNLSSLPSEFTALRRLADIDISHNELTSLPAGMAKAFPQLCQVPSFFPSLA